MKSVVLLRPDKAGDLLKTLPVIRVLTKITPDISIHVIASQANHSLLRFEPNITYSTLPSSWDKLTEQQIRDELAQQLKGKIFDVAVNLLCDPFPEAERLISLIAAQDKFSINSASLPNGIWPMAFKNGSPKHKDETLNIAELLEQALETEIIRTVDLDDRTPHFGQEDFAEAESSMGAKEGNWLAVCPFAGTVNRTHSTGKWKKFLQVVLKHKSLSKVILFGAPADLNTLNEIKHHLGNSSKLATATPSSFRALGGYLSRCDKVVAVDSGPLHLSLALGIPSLGFLSGGDHRRWFSLISSQDKIINRGLFDRFPSFWEMRWHFSRWA